MRPRGSAAQAFDVIVIGAGAAGLMCAMTAGARGRRVLVLDHAEAPGKKILISGGGRCNFTNLDCTPANFISANPHFCKSALARYDQHDFIALMDRHGIAWHERTLGQLFCVGSAKAVVGMLLRECRDAGVDLRLGQTVTDIQPGAPYRLETNMGAFTASSVVLATGGLSIPQMGATGFALDWAERLGLKLHDVRPGLMPLTVTPADRELMAPLSGVAIPCIAQHGKAAFREAMLLTHRGLSGPAILQISSFWRMGDAIHLNLLPDIDAGDYLVSQKRAHPKQAPSTVLAGVLPTRLAHALAAAHLPSQPLGELTDKRLAEVGRRFNDWMLTPAGSEGYAKAEVTAGGIDTACLSSKTMEAKNVPGLFVIGEAVDVTGWLGGYNFQWAWSSGHAAGEAA